MAKNDEIEKLRQTVNLMDNLSQDAFGRIRGVCRLALQAMEQHAAPVDMEDLAQALRQIDQAADEAESCINTEAEQVGANYKDHAWHRRMDAERAWRELRRVGG